jgi:hypothetical protein
MTDQALGWLQSNEVNFPTENKDIYHAITDSGHL